MVLTSRPWLHCRFTGEDGRGSNADQTKNKVFTFSGTLNTRVGSMYSGVVSAVDSGLRGARRTSFLLVCGATIL